MWFVVCFFFKQKTAYEMRISDWSSDVCSSDLLRDEGPLGLADRRLGRPSDRRASVAEISRMLDLYRGSYADFTVKHFHEQLVKRHGYKLGYTVTKEIGRASWRERRGQTCRFRWSPLP